MRGAALILIVVVAALAGCGDSEDQGTSAAGTDTTVETTAAADASTGQTTVAGGKAEAGNGGKIRVAALGDSITAGSPLWDPDPKVREQIGKAVDEESQFEFWASKEDPRLEFTNCGVFGERTDEIALRLDKCVRQAKADVLIVQGGINDIAQGASVDAAALSLQGMVQAGLDAGLDVAITDVLPWNNGHPNADGAIETLNSDIAGIAKEEGVPLLPFHDTLEDPVSPGTMKQRWTIDGDHPSVEGYRRLAEKAVAPQLPGG